MKRTSLSIPRMDCSAEEQLVRMALGGAPTIRRVDVDLPTREIAVYHEDEETAVLKRLEPLGLGTSLLGSTDVEGTVIVGPSDAEHQRRTLWIVLAINAVMFVGEFVGGYLADSSALTADSLDMFADAAVYGLALYGAGRGLAGQR